MAVVVHLAMSSIIFHKVFGHLCSDHINMAYLHKKKWFGNYIMQLIIALVNNSVGCQIPCMYNIISAQIINGLIYDTALVFKNTNVNDYDHQEVMSMISSIVHVYEVLH